MRVIFEELRAVVPDAVRGWDCGGRPEGHASVLQLWRNGYGWEDARADGVKQMAGNGELLFQAVLGGVGACV